MSCYLNHYINIADSRKKIHLEEPMKPFLVVMLGFMVLSGCSGSKEAGAEHAPPEKIQLGWMQRSDFVCPDFPRFQENYDTSRIDENFVEMLKSLHAGIDFVVVLGTWCGDSRREVPRFLKVADETSIPFQQILSLIHI